MEKELCKGFYTTPPLWINKQFGVQQFNFPKLDLLNLSAKAIPEQLRLGHKMEYVFEQLLNHSEDWKVLAKNLLIDRNKVRQGELDFVLQHKQSKETYHVELAYKFYIINPEITEPIHRLMGPNKRDMFFTKLEKLKQKQFPLLYCKELSKQLEILEIKTETVQQQACFKAQLFLPYEVDGISIRPLNKNCIKGSWVRFDDFNTAEFKKWQYYIPFKQEWVLEPSTDRNYATQYETLLDINLRMLKENAPMLWVKKPNGVIEKVFVVWW
ncbi:MULTISPECIES: DUF1853 family protein [unclassified Croceitalea]|uniref:DUF1853 family protein n=1 Tax=unclassified Croceitalea TaxID=2632280 RepID=UPI0030DD450B